MHFAYHFTIQIKLSSELGGSTFSCALLGVRWTICCGGSAGVHYDFLVGLVDVVSSCSGGLLFALDDVICMYFNG